MVNAEPMKTGLIVWAEGSAAETIAYLKSFGLSQGQLGVPPSLDCAAALEDWKRELAAAGVYFNSAACSYQGEDYASLQRVHESVGFTSPAYRAERIQRTKDVSVFIRELGIPALSCHIGFIPEHPSEPLYAELLELTRELCDACHANGQIFALETGQESAAALAGFIADVDRTNLKVNFDPANMVIYGSGDPIQALVLLQAHVTTVHCKDAHSPAAAGGMGSECRLGDGAVDFPSFLAQLKRMNYSELLTIEREEPDAQGKAADIRTAMQHLARWKTEAGI